MTAVARPLAFGENQSRPICACHLPWTSYPGADLVSQSFPNFQEPLCWFNNCKSTGYMKGLPSNLCPKCLQNLTINIGANSKADIDNISQSCDLSSGSGSTPVAHPLPTPTPAPSTPTTSAASTWLQANAVVVAAVAAAVLLLLIIVVTAV